MKILNAHQTLTLLPFQDIINGVEKALQLLENEACYMPNRMHVDRGNNTLLLMPCFTDEVFGTKIVTVFPNNHKFNQPAIQGIMLLNDGTTGKPIAIMDAAALTALRTGGLGALSIKYMTNDSVKNLGVIGTGIQGIYQTLMTCAIRNIETVFVYNRSLEKIENYKKSIHEHYPKLKIITCHSTNEVVRKSEIIITATSSNVPVFDNDIDLIRGKHFVGIGSYKPTMREFPQAVFQAVNQFFVDNDYAKKESGDVKTPMEKGWILSKNIFRLGELIKGEITLSKEETTVFKSVGMAVLDVVVGYLIYQKAETMNIGLSSEM